MIASRLKRSSPRNQDQQPEEDREIREPVADGVEDRAPGRRFAGRSSDGAVKQVERAGREHRHTGLPEPAPRGQVAGPAHPAQTDDRQRVGRQARACDSASETLGDRLRQGMGK